MFRARVDALAAPGVYGMVACADFETAREAWVFARSRARLELDPLSQTICGVPRHTALILITRFTDNGWKYVRSALITLRDFDRPRHSRLIMGAIAQSISQRRESATAGE